MWLLGRKIGEDATVIPRRYNFFKVSSLPWNACPVCRGPGVQFAAESLSSLAWNTHVGCTLLPALAAMPGVGSLQHGMVQIRPFEPPVPTRTIGIAWRHRYPRQATVKMIASVILDNLPKVVNVLQ